MNAVQAGFSKFNTLNDMCFGEGNIGCIDLAMAGSMMATPGDPVSSITEGVGQLVLDQTLEQIKLDPNPKTLNDLTKKPTPKTLNGLTKKPPTNAIVKGMARVKDTLGAPLGNAASKAFVKVLAQIAPKAAASLSAKLAAGAPIMALGAPGMVIYFVMMILQVTGMVIDSVWDPFQTYFNKDLDLMKQTIDATIRKHALEMGFEHPLEIKPNLFPNSEEEWEEFGGYIKKYYTNNSLVTPEEAEFEQRIYTALTQINRNVTSIRNINNITSMATTEQSFILLAAAAILRRNNENLEKALDLDWKTYKPKEINKTTQFIQYNWQIFASCCLCICLISFCIIFLSTTSNL
jgi:hypothetical protein